MNTVHLVSLLVVIRASNDMHVNFSSETILSALHPLSSSVLVLGSVKCFVHFEDVTYRIFSTVNTQM